MFIPQAAVVQGGESHHGFGIDTVPAASSAFDALSSRFAFRFGRATTDLPIPGAELRVPDHAAPLGGVLHEAVQGGSFLATAQRSSRVGKCLPSRLVAFVLERVAQAANPVLPTSDSSP